MPLLAMSANVQDGGGSETPSRKRTLEDFLSASRQPKMLNKPATPSKLRLVTDANADDVPADAKENDATHAADPPPDSPLSEISDMSDMSDSPLSLMTDAGSSGSLPVTPGQSISDAGSPQLVITIDGTPPASSRLVPTTNSQPPAKRKKLTAAEREEKAKADLARKQEKERADAAKKQERDEQKALAEAKKKALAEEKEKKRKQKEDEDRRKAEEKEKKRKDKEDEERRVQEAKNKKERSQLRLNSFFKTGNTASASASASIMSSTAASATPSAASSAATSTSASGLLLLSPRKNASPSPAVASGPSSQKGVPAGSEGPAGSRAATTPAPPADICEYDRVFKPFFIKENVIMATHLYGMDDETKEAKSRILDEYLSGDRGSFTPAKPFSSKSAIDYFHLPCDKQQRLQPRGQAAATRPTVRKIMNAMHSSGYGAGSDNAQTKMARDLLKKVPMKYLFFREDVRPAYFGTVTSQPPQARLSRLARNPLATTVLPLNYDYDSEAEWVDDGDGEDVDDLDDDEEDTNDDDGEMSDFLDDSEEGGMPLRPAFSGGMEPESTGICWENLESSSRRGALPRPELNSYRMEFILDHSGPIDPLSTKYWEAAEPGESAVLSEGTAPSAAAPADAFAALSGSAAAGAASCASATTPRSAAVPGLPADPKKAGVAAEFVADLKKGILRYAKLSKLGIVEILSVEFVGKCTKAQIKNSIDALAERTGTGHSKVWKLK